MVYTLAHVANTIVPIPVVDFGGIERFLYPFIKGQVRDGNEVTLYCAEGSNVPGATVVTLGAARKNTDEEDYLGLSIKQAYDATVDIGLRREIELVHDHTGFIAPFAGELSQPVVSTLHNGLAQAKVFARRCTENVTFVAISRSDQRVLQAAGIDVADFVYYDVDTTQLQERSLALGDRSERKLLWIGRMSPTKGPDLAVQVALRSGYKLLLAGFAPQEEYLDWFNETVQPFVDGDQVQYLGTINDKQKVAFFSGGKALLMPNRCYQNALCKPWREPFGVVQIESMACGVPVLGTNGGSLPEIIQDLGHCVDTTSDEETIERMVAALSDLDVAPAACRTRANDFAPGQAARKYDEIYARLLA